MKALITGTPVQIEGEPAEIAQLVELLSSGAVMVEHVHHWRLDQPGDDGLQHGRCWCGQERDFAPFDPANRTNAPTIAHDPPARAAVNVVAVSGARRPCGCSAKGKHRRTCLDKAAA